ncbi:unnamed protein product [Mytilus coruscus]|uniref:Uncharacterized protein n=1 Tax=Mytilus coruscus TaxID=42192 RepID=A0A6J8A1M9_MYTCO|nr:unnamed protein product [Mytilus coruscus]
MVNHVSANPEVSGRQAYDNVVQQVPRNERDSIPTYDCLRSSLDRTRRKHIPPIPATINDVAINGRWCLKRCFQQEMERSSWQTSSKLVVLFEEVKTEERRGALSVAAVRRGDRPPVRKRKYRLLQERIDRLTNSYRNGQRTLNQYWDAMVYTVAQFN